MIRGRDTPGVQIDISGTGGTFSTNTMTAGGYQVRIPAGTYTVTASGSNITTMTMSNVVIGADNVKVDFLVDNGNSAPVATNDVANVVEEGSVNIDVVANDTDDKNQIDATTVAIVVQPANGGVNVNPSTGQVSTRRTIILPGSTRLNIRFATMRERFRIKRRSRSRSPE